MLLKNYGLFWKTENVFWGRQKNSGGIFGLPAFEKRFGPVDFMDQAGIYALYADYDLLYVGQTGGKGQRLLARLNQHRRDDLAERWNMFSWFGTRAVSDDGSLVKEELGATSTRQEVLNHLEAILIHVAEPALNRQGGKWGDGVDKYLQHRDEERLGPTVDKMIEEMWKAKSKT